MAWYRFKLFTAKTNPLNPSFPAGAIAEIMLMHIARSPDKLLPAFSAVDFNWHCLQLTESRQSPKGNQGRNYRYSPIIVGPSHPFNATGVS